MFSINKTQNRSRSKSKTDNNNDKQQRQRSLSIEKEANDQNVLNYWVVGRRELRNMNKDFFICFHDTVPEILQEIAFDLGFSRFSY